MATYTWTGLKLTQKLSIAWTIGSLQTANLGILLLPDANIGAKLLGLGAVNAIIASLLGIVFGVDWE